MCYERNVSEVSNGKHANGEDAVITNASGAKVTAEDGFYFGKDDNSLVGPFPSHGSATTAAYAHFGAEQPAETKELASA